METAAAADGYQMKGGQFMAVFMWLIVGIVVFFIAAASVSAVFMCMSESETKYDQLAHDQKEDEAPSSARDKEQPPQTINAAQ